MLNPTRPSAEDRRKHLAALHRAVPVTRMVDCGAPLGDALNAHARTCVEAPPDWDTVCETLAERHAALAAVAEQSGHADTAARAWRAASALLQCAQLAFNADGPRKRALYQRSHEALTRHAAIRGDLLACELPAVISLLRKKLEPPPCCWPAHSFAGGLLTTRLCSAKECRWTKPTA